MQHLKIEKGGERGLNRAILYKKKKVRSGLLEYFCQDTRQKKKSGSQKKVSDRNQDFAYNP